MKKAFAAMLVLAMLLSALAVAEAADLVGMWYLVELSNQGQTFAPADLGMSMSIELKEDGTAHLDSSVEGGVGEGSWSVNGDVITIIDNAGTAMDMTLQDGRLVGDVQGVTMTLAREEPGEVIDFAPAAEVEAAEADFDGDWKAEWIGMEGEFYRASILGSEVNVNIESGAVTLNGFQFDNVALPLEFADGKLTFSGTDPDNGFQLSITTVMLEDGRMSLYLDAGAQGAVTFYLARVEEAPAA